MRFGWLVAMAAGCATGVEREGIQVGGEGDADDTCGEAVETVVSPSELVLGGHSGDEAMALVGGPTVFTPTWFDGRTSALTLTGARVGDTVTVVDYPDGGPGCDRHIEIDVAYELVSDDGALAETWEHRLRWSQDEELVDLPAQIPVGDLAGSLDWAAIAADADQLIVQIRLGGEAVGRVELASPALPGDASVESEARRTSVCEWDEREARAPSESGDTGE